MTTTAAAPRARPGRGGLASGKLDDHSHYRPAGAPPRKRGGKTDSRLRELRELAGLSQQTLAERTVKFDPDGVIHPVSKARVYGVTAYSINRYENGVHSPRPRYLRMLTKALSEALGRELTPDDLLMGGSAGLVKHLEGVRTRQGAGKPEFYGRLGVASSRRVEALLAGTADWTADELGQVALRFPESGRLAQDVLIEQAKRSAGIAGAESDSPDSPEEETR